MKLKQTKVTPNKTRKMPLKVIGLLWLCQFTIKTEQAILESYPECGKLLKQSVSGKRTESYIRSTIIKGEITEEHEFPWMVFLYHYDRSSPLMQYLNLNGLPDACTSTNITKTTNSSKTETECVKTSPVPGNTVEAAWDSLSEAQKRHWAAIMSSMSGSKFVNSANKEENKMKNSFCGASLINPRYVLTAAHCVDCRTIDDIAVIFGKNKIRLEENLMNVPFAFLSSIHVYPKYKRGLELDLKHNPDIALLRLETPAVFGPGLNALCLPTNPNDLYENKTMIIAGWGLIGHTPDCDPIHSDDLMKAYVEVLPNENCKTWPGYNFLKR